jgi:hypothetical protein
MVLAFREVSKNTNHYLIYKNFGLNILFSLLPAYLKKLSSLLVILAVVLILLKNTHKSWIVLIVELSLLNFSSYYVLNFV